MQMRFSTSGLFRINRLHLSLAFSFPFMAYGEAQSYPGPAYQQPASPPSTTKIQVLSEKVAQISANDQRQDIRIYHLERDVDKISSPAPKPPPSPETNTSTTPQLMPYVPYQVRKGDTLWRIAMNHRVSPGDIMGFNRMPNETVSDGQVLMIPQKGGVKATPQSVPTAYHTVQPNETFRSIGKKYGISSDAITKANPKVNPAKLMAGARLAIPAGASVLQNNAPVEMAYSHGLPAPKPAPAKTSATHIVQQGESLSVIAKNHNVTLASLQKANGITNPNTLRLGQKLVIPGGSIAASKPAPAQPKSGTKSTPAATPSSNPPAAGTGLANAPKPPAPPTKPTPPAPPPQAPSNRGVVAYRMDKGDTIDSVAQMFGTTGAEIRRLNRLTPNSPLHDGDEILVPGMGPVAGN